MRSKRKNEGMSQITVMYFLLVLIWDLRVTRALLERNASNRSALFVKVSNSVITTVDLALKHNVYTALKCMKYCLQTSNCKSVNYKRVTYDCYLKLHDRLDALLQSHSNFDYYDTIVAVSIAQGKPATQSSNHETNAVLALKANDGILIQNTYYDCQLTKSEPNAWWKVDLQKKYVIVSVKIWNRLAFPERLRDVNIEAADSEDFSVNKQLCAHFLEITTTDQIQEFRCNGFVYGRHVRILKIFHSHLQLCEVRVFGYELN